MTKIIVSYKNGNIISVECKNHAGYAEYGKDIVCAGISSITQTAVLGIKYVAKAKHKCVVDEKQGSLHLELLEDEFTANFKDAQVILNTMLCGLQDLQKQYPKYLKVEVK